MDKIVDYYFFANSPYTYMGHRRFGEIARAAGATIRVRPVDAGKIFPLSGGLPLAKRPPQRQAYRLVELKRWRDYLGIPLNVQPKFFPVATDAAARLIIAADETSPGASFDITGRILTAVWAEERDIADEATLLALANEAGLAGAGLLERSKSEAAQARYDGYTQEAIERQVFGAPTYFYRDEPFWGQDRLDFLQRALAR
ncbi:MAG TPA: 2-hydroxychromene-2-carboxylate isomerase [Burkholderiaceae bacterium]|nr:2-hydroxychromene-2-carboxylate isomerase [Burkholderiaceae bacterium]